MNVRVGLRLGFTLIELMMVVSIISILASIAIPKFAGLVRKSKEGQTKGSLGVLRSALSIYYSDMEGQWPTPPSGTWIETLTLNGKYLGSVPALYLPYYHADMPKPGYLYDIWQSCGGSCDAMAQSAATDEVSFSYPRFWLQVGVVSGGPSTADTSNEGNIWVSCTHTDARGTIWTSY